MTATTTYDFARRFITGATAAVTAGATEAMTRFMRGDAPWGPDVLKATVERALTDAMPPTEKEVLTPRARAAVVEALSVVGYNLAAVMSGKEPA